MPHHRQDPPEKPSNQLSSLARQTLVPHVRHSAPLKPRQLDLPSHLCVKLLALPPDHHRHARTVRNRHKKRQTAQLLASLDHHRELPLHPFNLLVKICPSLPRAIPNAVAQDHLVKTSDHRYELAPYRRVWPLNKPPDHLDHLHVRSRLRSPLSMLCYDPLLRHRSLLLS